MGSVVLSTVSVFERRINLVTWILGNVFFASYRLYFSVIPLDGTPYSEMWKKEVTISMHHPVPDPGWWLKDEDRKEVYLEIFLLFLPASIYHSYKSLLSSASGKVHWITSKYRFISLLICVFLQVVENNYQTLWSPCNLSVSQTCIGKVFHACHPIYKLCHQKTY